MPHDNRFLADFLELTIAIQEVHGRAGLLKILQDEITRLQVLDRIKAQQRVAAAHLEREAIEAEREQTNLALDIYRDALAFYGDANNYHAPKGKQSAIEKDQGRNARTALHAAVSNDDDERDSDDS